MENNFLAYYDMMLLLLKEGLLLVYIVRIIIIW